MKKKKFKFFEKNPELYEEAFSDRGISDQVKFLDKLFSEHKIKNVLDVACGHSPHGRKLAGMGYEVSGIDLSNSLLKLGNKMAKEENVKIKFYKEDMRSFKVGEFNAAYIMFSSILHLSKYSDLLAHFKSVSKNLKKEGLYVIDLSSVPFDSPFEPKEFIKKNGKLKTVINYKPLDASRLLAEFSSVSYIDNKKYNVDKFVVLMFVPLILLSGLAKNSGFEIMDIYSDFKFNKKINKDKPEYVAVLRKIK